jgi:hypothetical protein
MLRRRIGKEYLIDIELLRATKNPIAAVYKLLAHVFD